MYISSNKCDWTSIHQTSENEVTAERICSSYFCYLQLEHYRNCICQQDLDTVDFVVDFFAVAKRSGLIKSSFFVYLQDPLYKHIHLQHEYVPCSIPLKRCHFVPGRRCPGTAVRIWKFDDTGYPQSDMASLGNPYDSGTH